MLAQDQVTERLPDPAIGAHPEDEAIDLLVSRAIARGDHLLARDLAAVPPASDDAAHVLMAADCPALTRIAAVCDPIETLAWRRALVHAGVRSDRRRFSVLLGLAVRRCAD